MKKNNYEGMSGKGIVFHILYFLAFFGMLQTTFLLPIGLMATNAVNGKYFNSNQIAISCNKPPEINQVKTEPFIKSTTKQLSDLPINTDADLNEEVYYSADITMGNIGLDYTSGYDDVSDNIFKITINDLPASTSKAYLSYELYGMKDHTCIARSVNSRYAMGGVIVALSNEWTKQKEEIDIRSLHTGDNFIMYTLPDKSNLNYKVRNVRVNFKDVAEYELSEQIIFTNSPVIVLNHNNEAYIKGFFRNNALSSTIEINGRAIPVIDNEFVGNVPAIIIKGKYIFEVKLSDEKGIIYNVTKQYINAIEADLNIEEEAIPEFSYAIADPSQESHLSCNDVSINFPIGALSEPTSVRVAPLRYTDCAPMDPGLVNVTKGGKAYRFVPDGLVFNRPVEIAIAYDTLLIPKGYSESDVRSYYFNTITKRWEQVPFDSTDLLQKRVFSNTIHFSDYINGIIQVPESPQTASFTPTMMSDVKAADPAANINLISPPEATSNGSANISFPINTPAGRKGVQPSIVLNYNSDGGSGWMGLGWSIETPAITIDTRWGVPTFGDMNGNGSNQDEGENIETEIYQLNGEQLMYPPLDGNDWMPHRHTGEDILETIDRMRISPNNAFFTYRKQGDFSKIQRLGESPREYYWKVTTTDGNIYWYGGKTPADLNSENYNAVIRDDNDNIVHWALFMMEDTYGNCMRYSYYNAIYSKNEDENVSLVNGKYFYLKNINYTGFKDQKGAYNIDFEISQTPRPDASVNSRLGVMQVDPYCLKKINVKYEKEFIRSYELQYKNGRFDKLLLEKITELDKSGLKFYDHEMEYYDDILLEGKDVYFSTDYSIGICPDKCFRSEFVLPGISTTPIYKYKVDTTHSIILPYCSDKTLAKIEYIEVDGNQYVPLDENMYLTHYPAPLCPNYSIQNPPPPNPITQNTAFNTSFAAWLEDILDFMHPIDMQAKNLSGVYLLNSQADSNIANVNSFSSSFKSYNDKDINYRMVFPLYSELNYTGSFTKQLTYQTYTLPTTLNITTSTGSISLGPYQNLLDPYNFEIFQNDLISSIGGTPAPNAYLNNNGTSIVVNIPATQSDFIQITVISALENKSFPFYPCQESLVSGKPLSQSTSIESKNKNTLNSDEYDLNRKDLIPNAQSAFIQSSAASDNNNNNLSKLPGLSYTDNIQSRYKIKSMTSGDKRDNDCNLAFNNLNYNIPINTPSFRKSGSLLGATSEQSVNAGLYIGVGLGKNFLTKLTTLGLQFNKGWSRSEAFLSMVDIDGDGLDDVLIKSGDELYYKKHSVERVINENGEEEINHTYSVNLPLNGINNFYLQKGESASFNLQCTFGGNAIGGFAGTDVSSNSSESSVYLMDANGDGLIDVVKNGVVWFNHISDQGAPTFTLESDVTENMLITASSALIETPEEFLSHDIKVPGHDVVRVWEAPADGAIQIKNDIYLTDVSKEAQVTIEMPDQKPNCFTTEFAVRDTIGLWSYKISYYEMHKGPVGDHEFCLFPNRTPSVSCVKRENVSSVPSEDILYMNHFQNNILTNKCPLDPIYTGEYIGIRNDDFSYDYKNFLSTSCFSNDPYFISGAQNQSKIKYNLAENRMEYENKIFLDYTNYYLHEHDTTIIKIISNDQYPYIYEENKMTPRIMQTYSSGALFYFDIMADDVLYQHLGPVSTVSFEHLEDHIQNLFHGCDATVSYTHEGNFLNVNLTISNTSYSFQTIRVYMDKPPYDDNTYSFNACNRITNNVSFDKKRPESEKRIEMEEKGFPMNIYIHSNTDPKAPYKLKIRENSFKWYNASSELIEDTLLISELERQLPEDKEKLYRNYNDSMYKTIKLQDSLNYLRSLKDITYPSNVESPIITNSIITSYPMCLLFGAKLDNNNTEVHNNITTISCNQNSPLTVKKGDTIYFRVHTGDGENPAVIWDPKVEYVDNNLAAIQDQNGLTPFSSSYSDGFILSSNSFTNLQGNGKYSIDWQQFEVDNFSDAVSFEVINRTISQQNEQAEEVIDDQVIFSQTIDAGETGLVIPTGLNNIMFSTTLDFPIIQQSLGFRVKATSNVNWKAVEWKPVITVEYDKQNIVGEHNTVEGDIVVEETIFPVADYDIYKSYINSAQYTLYNIPNNTGNILKIEPALLRVFYPGDNATLYFVVKSQGQLLGKKTIAVDDGIVSILSGADIFLSGSESHLEIGYYTDETNLDFSKISSMKRMSDAVSPLAVFTSDNTKYDIFSENINLFHKAMPVYGTMYRNWGQFMYNPDAVTDAFPLPAPLTGNFIKEDVLVYNESYGNDLQIAIENIDDYDFDSFDLTDIEQLNAFESAMTNFQNANKPLLNMPLLIATPSRLKYGELWIEKWIGQHELCYSAPTEVRATDLNQSYTGYLNEEDEPIQDELFTGAYAISRYSVGEGKNISGGISVLIANVNGTISLNGDNKSLTDYIDMNGDRYPDIVGAIAMQPTNRTGGLRNKIVNKPEAFSGEISHFTNSNSGFGASGSYSIAGEVSSTGSGNKRPIFPTSNPNAAAGIGASASFNNGESESMVMWLDINGDGLADKLVRKNDGKTNIFYNNGNNSYSFTQVINIPISKSVSESYSGGIGFNWKKGSAEAGISTSRNYDKNDYSLQDINGDGLPDLVIRNDQQLSVRINTGGAFGNDTIDFVECTHEQQAEIITNSLNAGISLSLIIPLLFVNLKVPCVNINGQVSESANRSKRSLSDFDGDGYPDLIEEVDENTITVRYSTIRRTNKLKKVTNALKGSFMVDYQAAPKTYENPNAQWVMSSVIIDDGYGEVFADGVDKYAKKYEYINGRYDRREREFLGYATVKTMDCPVGKDNKIAAPYRTNETFYHNNSYYFKGRVKGSRVYAGNNPEKLFLRDSSTYILKPIMYDEDGNTASINYAAANLDELYDVGGKHGRSTAAVLLDETISYIYELDHEPVFTKSSFVYDTKGRLIVFKKFKDNSLDLVGYDSKIEYHDIEALAEKNIINVPSSITVSENNIIKRSRVIPAEFIDPATGAIKKIIADIDGTLQSETEMEYDLFGNLASITYPGNPDVQRMSYHYSYDKIMNKYVIEIKDVLGYKSSAEYDFKFDAVLKTIDKAGNETRYLYDNAGRLIRIAGPKEIASSSDPFTIKFEYYPTLTAKQDNKEMEGITANNFMPFAITKHFDDFNNYGNTIDTKTFSDGLGRVVQVKKDIEINLSPNRLSNPDYKEAMSVSGMVVYDEYGRAVLQFQPGWEQKIDNGNNFVNTSSTQYFTEISYDELDRPVKSMDAEENVSITSYFISNGRLVTRNETQKDNNSWVINESYKNLSGNVVKTNGIDQSLGESITTSFNYNEIGELGSYTDAKQLTSAYTYDKLGRKTSFNHPDQGLTSYHYDLSGNLIKLYTANLGQNSYIEYKYDHNRLTNVIFPPDGGNQNVSDVSYTYGGPDAGNGAGRIIGQTDATGSQVFTYGNMGEVITIDRIVVSPDPNYNYLQFTMSFAYDSWNRIQKITYPDREMVSYYYDLGGNLKQIKYSLGSSLGNYLSRIEYDHFEQKTVEKYANGVYNLFDYSPELRRLARIHVLKPRAGTDPPTYTEYLKTDFSFDKIGNITTIDNNTAPVNELMGKFVHSYRYDNFNRLTYADGKFTGSKNTLPNKKANYTLQMEYSSTGEINKKVQVHSENGLGTTLNTYAHTYTHEANSHRLEKITNQNDAREYFEYDNNGNLTRSERDNVVTTLQWDEANRLKMVTNPHFVQHYLYDASGERVLKTTGRVSEVFVNGELKHSEVRSDGYTVYPNGYLTISSTGIYTKHYYMGTQRLVSRPAVYTPGGWKDGSEPELASLKKTQQADLSNLLVKAGYGEMVYPSSYETDEDTTRAEQPLYYFHPDHLGSSTLLTDNNGNPYQFFLNLPFGETMTEQKASGTYTNPYRFNGKELDDETGLYYYGARYYNPRYSVWLGVDPMVEKYAGISPYAYCMNNPVRLIDPDGKEPTPNEAIALIKHINNYFKGDLIGDWKLDKSYDDRNQSGFTGGMYSRIKDDGDTEYAFVTRGSDIDFSKLNRESTRKDWENNLGQLSGATEQYKKSVSIARKLSSDIKDELTFVGQSLGGGLASANALATGRRGITFNAAGLSEATLKDLSLNNKSANITAWIMKGEIADYLQSMTPGVNRAYGRRVELMPSLPYVPGISPPLKAVQIYQRVQNHFIEAFDGKFEE